MKRQVKTPMYIGSRLVVLIMFCFLAVAILRFLNKNIMKEKLGIELKMMDDLLIMDNAGIELVEERPRDVPINWQELYPFEGESIQETVETVEAQREPGKIEKLITSYRQKIVQHVKNTLEYYYDKQLFLKNQLIAGGAYIEKSTHWGFSEKVNKEPYIFWNGRDGYITQCLKWVDVSEAAGNLVNFSAFLRNEDIPFLYVQYPCKTSNMDEEELPKGYTDYADTNVDDFLEILNQNDIEYLDLREEIAQTGQNIFSLFFRTDHHWKVETGLWATGVIAKKMNVFGMEIDTSVFASERYQATTYKGTFLGSYGRRVSMGLITPDDLTVLQPVFETELMMYNHDKDIKRTGNFYQTCLDLQMLYPHPSYHLNSYATFMWGDEALIQVENYLTENDKSILIIKDSFANVVSPFLSLGVKNVDIIDLRYFRGSLESYIKENRPDMVLCTYSPDSIADADIINYEKHNSSMDFR